MADRSIVVKLSLAYEDFKKGLAEAGKATKGAQDAMESASSKAQGLGRAVVDQSTKLIAGGVVLGLQRC